MSFVNLFRRASGGKDTPTLMLAPSRTSVKSTGKAPPPATGSVGQPAQGNSVFVNPPDTLREVDGSPGSQLAAVPASDQYDVFASLPNFIGVLTAGERPTVLLTPEQKKSFVVLELSGRCAQVIVSSDRQMDATALQAMTGILRSERFSLLPLKYAPDEVIAEVYSGGGSAASANTPRSGNKYLDVAREWVSYALENDATDIHIETRGSVGQVRFRIHGEIEAMVSGSRGHYPSSFVQDVMAILYNNAQQKKSSSGGQFEAEKNLYCMVPFSDIPGHSLKLRYQSIKGNEGPKAVLRLLHLNESKATKGFAALGYADSHSELLETAMNTPSGAVLFAGITGSGKSTTQKSFIELNPNAPGLAIYTVEDPVEYPIRHTHQVPIQRDLSNPTESAKTFNETMAALVRLDPDIAMLGEIRDHFSAMALQQMVETGHMGLGTIHAHLISGIIPRLTNPEIGMSREALTAPNMLTLLCYQALAPILCGCAMTSEEARRDSGEVAKIIDLADDLKLPSHQLRWKRVGGCTNCNSRGTTGLTVVAEMLMPDEDWLRCIRDGRDLDALNIYKASSDRDLESSNMTGKTAFEHTLYKALSGQVDARQCSRFDVWARFIRQRKELK